MQALDKQVKNFAQQRLADALFLEELGVDIAGLISVFKLVLLELDQVSTKIMCICQNLKSQLPVYSEHIFIVVFTFLFCYGSFQKNVNCAQ
jgi:hypothetical protein